jgi:anti-anti-sigma regulatory factor
MKLPNVLDFAAATGLHQSVLEGLKASKGLRIDASAVEVMSLPCMQVLLAAAREGAIVVNPSPAFTEAFETLALDLGTAIEFQSDPLPMEEPAPILKPLSHRMEGL